MVRGTLVHRSTLKTARTLLDRFFRDAEGLTSHKIDVGFLLSELGLSREKADPAVDYLVSRGLLTTFGPDVAFLTDEGVRASAEEVDIASLGPARTFGGADAPEPPSPPADSPAATRPQLVHVELDGPTVTAALGSSCSIGRTAENDIAIDDPRASKRHAIVRYERGAYVLEDLASANGTLLNGVYCVEPTRLENDDEIVIGRHMFVFQAPPSFLPPPGAESEAPEAKVDPPTSSPHRPVAPDLAGPGIRVVRGRPESRGPQSSPSDLFNAPDEARAPIEDLFRDDDGPGSHAPAGSEPADALLEADPEGSTPLELTEIHEPGPDPSAGEVEETSREIPEGPGEDDEHEKTHLPGFDAFSAPDPEEHDTLDPPTVDATPGDAPAKPSPLVAPVAERNRHEDEATQFERRIEDLQPTLLGHEAADRAALKAWQPPRDLGSDLDDFDHPEGSKDRDGRAAADAAEADTVSMSQDVLGEDLPVATASYAGSKNAAGRLGQSQPGAARLPRLLGSLFRLRAHLHAAEEENAPSLVAAVDLLLGDPLVVDFAEDEERENHGS